ncbi:hypothetical protein SYNPS1DRAFT_28479 [Syncephalis pseudoplumigaleata]|uniref:BRCT domain-containing protein n=1 Tax=Syncephalis pseudoplumigaleata TaxID=1712513 RepID=A0A4P9Z033_9FUNG|nr:hypothetical protein SYNPS1DRAFT_28479 [Syncephalis pseudoplumigaleata]|eukprot:RKP25797.1 hypothetical protein SYNPS1DRAFT_28479 [Syncephalis pseudoplumigaleata]
MATAMPPFSDDASLMVESDAVTPSSYDPMLISELDEPPPPPPPTASSTAADIPAARPAPPAKTYGHPREIAGQWSKTRTSTDSRRQRPVFDGVYYWINPFMARPLRDELHGLLHMHGGIDTSRDPRTTAMEEEEEEEEDRLFNARFSLARTTHCISCDYDFPEYEEAVARGIHIVTIPDMDRDALFGGVEAFGGQWQERMVKEVTHLITLTASGPRYESAMQHPELGIKIVLPHWLDDCFRLRRRIPEVSGRMHQYLFPNPPLLQSHPWLSSLPGTHPTAPDAAAEEATAPSDSAHRGDPHCLAGYRVYLADDLKITEETHALLEARIKEVGGELCSDDGFDRADMVICRWRTSRAYEQAIMGNKTVGTLNWLFHLLITRRLESSTSQLLHYPPPKHGMPDMRHFIITISGYTGMAREYLKRLIILCGAQYTAEMTRHNTHVICAEPQGQKYVAASEWHIIVVNHLWLEESYRAWQVQSVTRHHYTHFPVGPSLHEIVGQTGYRPVDLEPWRARAQAQPQDEASDAALDHPAVADTVREIPPSDHEDDAYTGPSARQATSYQRRQSALEANARLSDLVQSMNEFEREMRRAYRQRIQAKRPSSSTGSSKARREAAASAVGSKRMKLATHHRRMIVEEEEEEQEEQKKDSKEKEASVMESVCILTTGVKLTPADLQLIDALCCTNQQGIARLGGKVVTDARHCTHLIAKSAARTEKFLSALARACAIVTYGWLARSMEEGRFVGRCPL